MATGFVNANLAFPEQKVTAPVTRYIAEIAGFVPFEEHHTDTLEITDHPIEQGAKISDHAYKRPSQVTIKFGWSNSSLGGTSGASHSGSASGQVAAIYQALLGLQASRIPFQVMTGKRLYQNMLMAELTIDTDKQTESALMVTAIFKEVLLVTTSTIQVAAVPAEAQENPQATQSTTNTGTKQLVPATAVNEEAVSAIFGE